MDPQRQSFIVRWIIDKKIAADEQGAYRVILIGVFVFLFIVWLLWPHSGPQVSKGEQTRQRQEMERTLPGFQSRP